VGDAPARLQVVLDLEPPECCVAPLSTLVVRLRLQVAGEAFGVRMSTALLTR
jgi:hypothetical protein